MGVCGRVVDALELCVKVVAVRACEDGTVPAEHCDEMIITHF